MLIDCIYILCASLFSALLAEAISWLLIYRTDDYQKLKATIERLQKKVEKKKEDVNVLKKGKDKKVDRIEETLKNANRDMAMVKMKSNFAVGITLITLLAVLNSSFDGKVVAKLPFEPFGLITGLSHRGLSGSDYTDCSMVFFYVLSSLSIRPNLQKILNTAPPKQASPFGGY